MSGVSGPLFRTYRSRQIPIPGLKARRFQLIVKSNLCGGDSKARGARRAADQRLRSRDRTNILGSRLRRQQARNSLRKQNEWAAISRRPVKTSTYPSDPTRKLSASVLSQIHCILPWRTDSPFPQAGSRRDGRPFRAQNCALHFRPHA